MIFKRVLIVFCIFNLNVALSSDCHPRSKYELFSEHDVVFLAKVIGSTSDYFKVIVIENYKGFMESDTLRGLLTNESVLPRENEIWLFYANWNDGLLEVNICSGSKSFSNPIGYHDVIPDPPSNNIESLDIFLKLTKYQFINDLYFEIQSLREWSSNRPKVEDSRKEFSDESEGDNTTTINILIILVCISLIINLIILRKLLVR